MVIKMSRIVTEIKKPKGMSHKQTIVESDDGNFFIVSSAVTSDMGSETMIFRAVCNDSDDWSLRGSCLHCIRPEDHEKGIELTRRE